MEEARILISLEEEEFTQLVRGDELVFGKVRIILRDIGYHRMELVVAAAQAELTERMGLVKVRRGNLEG